MLNKQDAAKLIGLRHPEWTENQEKWRWLQDSLEGGDRYRHADYFRGPFDPPVSPWYAYGFDKTTGEGYPIAYGQISRRNLVPHQSEMSVQNRDLYALRLNRTPIPATVSRTVRKYLSRVYSRSVSRSGPPQLKRWWEDVDGTGTAQSQIGGWMRKTVGPLLLTLGQLDLVFGYPETPPGATVDTLAQARKLGLDGVVAGYILPQNLVWWKLNQRKQYLELVVREQDETGAVLWRHWTCDGCDVYTNDGDFVAARSFPYRYGRPPIVRVFDERQLRSCNIGQSRLETIAGLQKNIYNRKSELIIGDVQYLHPIIQGPEDYCQGDKKVPVGPGGALPKKKTSEGRYEGWDMLDMPQSGAKECREHIQDDEDEALGDAALLKPAGSTTGSTVSQSGVSKGFDAREGNDILAEVASMLRDTEVSASRMAMIVATEGRATEAELDSIAIDYPGEFDLMSAADLGSAMADLQALAAAAGVLPETETEILKRLVSALLPGLDEVRLGELHGEIKDTVAAMARRMDQAKEAGTNGQDEGGSAEETGGDGEADGAQDGAYSTADPAISLPSDVDAEVNVANVVMSQLI
jgi:hypothetical protein